MRRMVWVALLAVVLPLLLHPRVAGADGEYSEEMVTRAAQAIEAIQAGGVDPNDIYSAPTIVDVPWDFDLPDEDPFSFYDPGLGAQLVIAVPPRPSDPNFMIPNCHALAEQERQAQQLQHAVLGLGAGYGVLLAWAQNFGSWALQLVPALRVATTVMAVINVTVQLYQGQLGEARAYGCPA